MKKHLLLILILLLSINSFSQRKKEAFYIQGFSKIILGKTEVVLSDKSRVDILSDEYAIEVDFIGRWAESIGQSLFYSEMTGKKPAVLLLVNGNKNKTQIQRFSRVAFKYHITFWILDYNINTFDNVKIKENVTLNEYMKE